MNRFVVAVTLAGMLTALAACATAPTREVHFNLLPTVSNGQALAGVDSKTIVESRHPGGIVSMRADQGFAPFGASFVIAVQNKTGAPMEFGPQNISASVNGKVLPVLAAEELDAKIKGEARGFLRASARTGGVDVESATAAVSREYRFNNYGGNPAGGGGGASCALTDDGCRAYRVDRDNRTADAKLNADVAYNLMQNTTAISQRALRRESIAPEAMAGGVIVIEPPKEGGPLNLIVTVNGQKHQFTFAASPAPAA